MAEPHLAQHDQVNDSLSLWHLIEIGDRVRIEASLMSVEGDLQLRADRYYEVIGKSAVDAPHHSLYVQSDITGEVIELFPGFVADYQRAQEPAHHA
ncbi:hypothetical protein [Marinobacterium mangrovicola]|uniref:Uncharacterized protein n=1 Tax=Marinobacterium mangrovicola TaxID=1476959 RepID=A0A4R1GSC1_9GAMM|nr:hypothetical protein [Marinobacterium mangrovicola]TCK09119.1 hypothetical protein CLV83_1222 [Marinobacterium mangrovicola]